MIRRIYSKLPPALKSAIEGIYLPSRLHRFNKIKRNCNGLLSAEVYYLMYSYASTMNDGNILEIGSAHGAGAISLALGSKESGASAKVVAVEKGEYDTRPDTINNLNENIDKYDVENHVEVVQRRLTIDEGLPDVIESHAPFSILVLDADGRLDRDFKLLYEHLPPGAIIIIDDYDLARGGKHYRTFVYVNLLSNNNYINIYKIFGDTLVAAKPPESPDIADLDFSESQEHLDEFNK